MTAPAPVIVTTPEELDRIVRRAVEEAMKLRAPSTDWLTASQVAELLGVHERTVQAKVRREGLPAHRIGTRSFRYRRDEVEDWIRQRSTRKAG